MKECVLSFCIPTYNIATVIEESVCSILESSAMDFEVVVVDDCSSDDTATRLEKYKDKRFAFIQNEHNLGERLNWLKALKSGKGKWLYFVIGRDKLYFNNVNRLIELLNNSAIDSENVVFLMDRKVDGEIELFDKYGAYERLIDTFHPTGLIIRRTALNSIKNIEEIFLSDRTTVYPEIELKVKLLEIGRAAIINGGVFANETIENGIKKKSSLKENYKGLYFMPDGIAKEFIHIVSLFDNVPDFTEEMKESFFAYKFEHFFLRGVTTDYKMRLENYIHCSHYNIKKHFVSKNEIANNINKGWSIISDKACYSEKRVSLANKMMNEMLLKYEDDLEMYSNYKNACVVSILSRMMNNKLQNKNYSQILEGKLHIAILGYSTIGKLLYDELSSESINVECFIDRNYNSLYAEIEIVPYTQIPPGIRTIIITTVDENARTDLIENIQTKAEEAELLYIEDLVYGV